MIKNNFMSVFNEHSMGIGEQETEIVDESLIEFQGKVRGLAENEIGSSHFKQIRPELLDSDDMDHWNQFEELVNGRDPKEIIVACEELAAQVRGIVKDPDDPKITSQAELSSWMRSRLAVIESEARGVESGDLTIEEFEKFMEERVNEIEG